MWFTNERLNHTIVTNEILKIKAVEFQKEFHISEETFKASLGWVEKWKKRHGIRLLKICGEKLSANELAVPQFKQDFINKINENNLRPEQIYNADESGLVYKSIGNKTLVLAKENGSPGHKQSKERITIMPCINATGNHKLPLMIIGKSKNPRCFKNEIFSNVYYKSSKNAWQTTILFQEWFFNSFIPEVKKHLASKNLPLKAILLLDNATPHGNTETLKSEDGNFFVFFFPPNTTSILQPLDQQIIQCLKQNYRKKLLFNILAMHGNSLVEKLKKINLKSVLIMVLEAWTELKNNVVINAFKHLFNNSTDALIDNLPLNYFNEEDDIPIAHLYRQVSPESNLNDNDILNWASGEADGGNRSSLTNAEIVVNSTLQDIPEEDENPSIDINLAINGLNDAIEWGYEQNIPLNEILTLRKVRERALKQKYKC